MALVDEGVDFLPQGRLERQREGLVPRLERAQQLAHVNANAASSLEREQDAVERNAHPEPRDVPASARTLSAATPAG